GNGASTGGARRSNGVTTLRDSEPTDPKIVLSAQLADGLRCGCSTSQLDASPRWRDPFRVITARLARSTDLPSLLELFAASEVSPAVQPIERAETVWQETLGRPGVYARSRSQCSPIWRSSAHSSSRLAPAYRARLVHLA